MDSLFAEGKMEDRFSSIRALSALGPNPTPEIVPFDKTSQEQTALLLKKAAGTSVIDDSKGFISDGTLVNTTFFPNERRLLADRTEVRRM